MTSYELLRVTLSRHAATIGDDLASVEFQKVRTTKHDRRERALAYLLESLSGYEISNWGRNPWREEEMPAVWAILDKLKLSPLADVKVAAKRTERRLAYHLNDAVVPRAHERCVACGAEMIDPMKSCSCDNPAGRAKDAAMARDDQILLTDDVKGANHDKV